MTAVALKSLAQRRLRVVLTGLAIVLGIAMVSGSLVLTDTVQKGFDTIFVSSYDGTDAVISGRALVEGSAGGAPTLPAGLLQRVRALPGVEAAGGSIVDLNGEATRARLLDGSGRPLGANGNPTFGFGIDPAQPRFNPMQLAAGRWARGRHEVVVDAFTAEEYHLTVGDTVRVAARGPVEQFRIVGTARYGDVATLGGATIAVFSIPTARELLGIDGFTAISVAARPGVSTGAILDQLRPLTPADAQVQTAADKATRDAEGVSSFVSFIRGFLLAFGGIALFVGGFVIFNALSITVAQRTRELATLRMLGASRRQVFRSVLVEAGALGTVASAVGVGGGIGLAHGLSALVGAFGLTLPESSTVYAVHTFVAPMIVGVVITLAAGLVPALRATRVPPLAAVRDGAAFGRPRRRLYGGIAAVCVGGAAVAWSTVAADPGRSSTYVALAIGAVLLILGVGSVGAYAVPALTRLVGVPSRRLGGAAGGLACENAARNPARTAATAGALMIGLALVTFVAVLGASVHDSLTSGVTGKLAADWVVAADDGWSPFPAAAGDILANAPGVELAASIRTERAIVDGSEESVNGVDPATIAELYRFDWRHGSETALDGLHGDGAVVLDRFAREHGLAIGDQVGIVSPSGRHFRVDVVGTYAQSRVAELLGSVLVGRELFDRSFTRPSNGLVLVRGGSQAGLERALSGYPDAAVRTPDAYAAVATSFVGQLLNLLYALLALSVLVSLLGMVNTLVLSVFERTGELGMLRAVGMTRRQVRRMIRHESTVTSLIGAALGLPLGLAVAAAVAHTLGSYGVTLSLPGVTLVAFVAVAVAAGMVAAVLPARRAGRLPAIAALRHE